MEPRASGRQMAWLRSWVVVAAVFKAWAVLILKKTVPTVWMTAASQSIRWGDHEARRRSRAPAPDRVGSSAATTCAYCRSPAVVKKMEPTK